MEIVCKNRSVRAIVQAFYQDPAHSTNTVVIFMQIGIHIFHPYRNQQLNVYYTVIINTDANNTKQIKQCYICKLCLTVNYTYGICLTVNYMYGICLTVICTYRICLTVHYMYGICLTVNYMYGICLTVNYMYGICLIAICTYCICLTVNYIYRYMSNSQLHSSPHKYKNAYIKY